MNPVSGRFAVPLLAIVLVALIPLAAAVLRPVLADDCANPDAMLAVGAIGDSTSTRERFRLHAPRRYQWTEGRIRARGPGRPLMRFWIVRSNDVAYLTQHPTSVLRGEALEPDKREFAWTEDEHEGESLPIYTLYEHGTPRARFLSYTFFQAGGPTANPLVSLARSALAEVFAPRRTLTLLVVEGTVENGYEAVVTRATRRWLQSAWEHYDRWCVASDR